MQAAAVVGPHDPVWGQVAAEAAAYEERVAGAVEVGADEALLAIEIGRVIGDEFLRRIGEAIICRLGWANQELPEAA